MPFSSSQKLRSHVVLHVYVVTILASICLALLVSSTYGFSPASVVAAAATDSPFDSVRKEHGREMTKLSPFTRAINGRNGRPISLHTSLPHRGGGSEVGTTSTVLRSTAISPQLLTCTWWAGLATVTGTSLAFAPVFTTSLYGIETETGTFATYLAEAIGCVMLGHGITLICATVLKTSVQRALGYGILVRLLFLFKSFFSNVYEKIDAKTGFLSVNTVILSWCTFSLLTGKGNPLVASKTFSTAALLKASLMFFNPIKASKKFFGIAVGTDGTSFLKYFTLFME